MNNIMKYKGYWAEISYSDEDECFCGKIEGLKNDLISFEGETVKELKKDFKDAINNYLETCKELNKEPEKQCKGSLNVRLGVELHNKAKMKSIEQNISINELIKNAVVAYLKTN
ncbi:MAG: type II toxin-antitoxin system HicB family antitoxin [Clostridia bacterium]|nr:type II toxin-antitoxin system HicB family antitoxin [Clostridia bacterium]